MYVDMLAANATYFVLSENVHLSSGYSLRSRMVTNGIKLESEVHLLADLGASEITLPSKAQNICMFWISEALLEFWIYEMEPASQPASQPAN